jgi:magnesium chelatase subunit D
MGRATQSQNRGTFPSVRACNCLWCGSACGPARAQFTASATLPAAMIGGARSFARSCLAQATHRISRLPPRCWLQPWTARVSSHLEVSARHWHIKQRRTRARSPIIFVVDVSGSMAASARMHAAKGAVCALLEEAYQKRDYVTLIAFHGEGAERLLPPTRSAVFAYRRLGELPAGGCTPVAAGLWMRVALR